MKQLKLTAMAILVIAVTAVTASKAYAYGQCTACGPRGCIICG